ncbi:gene transfer agent family protein [Cytobacillus firmus]|nr:gene transfer agent family protein [Cytobacillus firmus]
MANKEKGIVSITLDKERTLRFTLNSLAEIEDKLGVPLSKMAELELGIKTVRTMLWAGLIHEDEDLTEKEVGNMVDFTNLNEVQTKVSEAFAVATAKN